jgi:hypothetical protein
VYLQLYATTLVLLLHVFFHLRPPPRRRTSFLTGTCRSTLNLSRFFPVATHTCYSSSARQDLLLLMVTVFCFNPSIVFVLRQHLIGVLNWEERIGGVSSWKQRFVVFHC